MNYFVPDQTLETTLEIKKSLFHARAGLATNREQAMALLSECKAAYPDARHHCWAYLFGNPQHAASAAMSDDGEPSGTAGKPILNVLQHGEVGDVMVVVSRYFGGIKLGAGGLVRAYSAATQQTMEQLTTREQVTLTECTVVCDFRHEQPLRHWLGQCDGEVVDIQYGNHVTAVIGLQETHLAELHAFAAERGMEIMTGS